MTDASVWVILPEEASAKCYWVRAHAKDDVLAFIALRGDSKVHFAFSGWEELKGSPAHVRSRMFDLTEAGHG